MVQNIPPMDRLLRPAVNVLIGHGATPIEQEFGACLEEIFPEQSWRLDVHEAATSQEIFSTVRSERIHLCILFLKSIDCAPTRKAVIGPASPLGMIRILRLAWNVPIIAIDDSFVEPGRGDEALRCGADCFLRWPFEIRRLKDEIEAMTSVFYSHTRLAVIGIPEPVRNLLRNWDGLGAVAFESFKKYGRVVIGIESDEARPGRAKLTAMTCNPFGGWPDREISQGVLSYDPESEIVIRFTDNGGRVRTERLRTGPGGNIPKKAHKNGLLSNTLGSVKIKRTMAPLG
jgi:hypothetical protein